MQTVAAHEPDEMESLVKRLGAREMEFLAEDTLITIESRFRHEKFHFIKGDFGPFIPMATVEVPLWFGVALKKRKKCRIKVPDWLYDENLEEVLRAERAREDDFQALPYHYVEISALLLKHASDDFPSPDRTRSLLEDIENVRMEKLRRGLQRMSDVVMRGSSVMSAKLNNVGAMEITVVRDFLTQSMNMFYVLSGQDDKRAGAAGSRRRSSAFGTAGAQGGMAGAGSSAMNGPPRKLRRFRDDTN